MLKRIVFASSSVFLMFVSPIDAQADLPALTPITADNVADITELTSITDNKRFYSDVVFQPDGEVLVVIAVDNVLSLVHDGEVIFLDAKTLEAIPFLDEPVRGMSITFSPDGTHFAVGTQSGTLTLFDLNTGTSILDQNIDNAEISDVSISFDNMLIAVAIGTLSTVQENQFAFKVLDITSSDIVLSLEVTDSPFTNGADGAGVAFLNADTIALTTTDGIVRVWNISTGEETLQIEGTMSQTGDIEIQNNGEHMAYINGEDVILVTFTSELANPARSIAHAPERNFIRSITFHPFEPILAIGYERQLQTGTPGDRDGVIRLWNVETNVELIALEGHTDIVTDLAFSPDGRLLASGGADGAVRLWGVSEG